MNRIAKTVPSIKKGGDRMSRNLKVASTLLFVVGIVVAFMGFPQMFSLFPWPEELPTMSQIRDFSPELADTQDLSTPTRGLYLLTLALFWCVISLIPYRKGEKWAWYAMLVIGALFMSGFLIVSYIGVTLGLWASFYITISIILLIVWIVGLALPAKEILGKPSK